MGLPLETTHRYTYADYLAWPDDVRHELIDGDAFLMALPGVRLPKGDEADAFITNVVEPDVLIVCDPAKLTERGVRGVPDWILEVISPGSAAHDSVVKLRLYETAGVREFWLVHPVDRVLTVNTLGSDGLYGRSHVQTLDGVTELSVLPGVRIDWGELRLPVLAAEPGAA